MTIDISKFALATKPEIKELYKDSLRRDELSMALIRDHIGFLIRYHGYNDPQETGERVVTLPHRHGTTPEFTMFDVVGSVVDDGGVVDEIKRLHSPDIAGIFEKMMI